MFMLLIVPGSAWFVYGDVGCGIDTDRKTLVCGGGLFVWKGIGQYPTADHSVELASYDLITKYLFEMFKETTKGCIVCEDKLQCAAARSVAYHALTKLGHPTVYLNISNSYDSVFDELPRHTNAKTTKHDARSHLEPKVWRWPFTSIRVKPKAIWGNCHPGFSVESLRMRTTTS